MKKVLLFAAAIGLAFTTNAQTARVKSLAGVPKAEFKNRYSKETSSAPAENYVMKRNNASTAKSNANGATITPLGQAVNGLTLLNPNRFIWWDPVTNAISYVRRGTPAAGTSGQEFWLDFSADGGLNWTIDATQVYAATNGNGRHPHSYVYNPPGNTNPNNVFVGWAGAGLEGTNDAWGAKNYGLVKPDGSASFSYYETSDPGAGTGWVTQDDVHKTDNGDVYMVSQNLPFDGTDFIYNGMVVDKGVWNGTDLTWSAQTINHVFTLDGASSQITDSKIVFDPSGQVGYISMLGHDDFTLEPDSVFYPIIYKTTDGGATWNLHAKVRLQDLTGINDYKINVLGATASTDLTFTPTFEHSITLDAVGNLHIAFCGQFLLPDDAGFTYYLIKGNDAAQQTIWDVRSNDGLGGAGGSAAGSWVADLVAVPMAATGTLGSGANAYNMNNWVKTTIDPTRQYVGITWLDTDTVLWGSANGNYTSDLFARGYVTATNYWQPASGKLTGNTIVDANVYYGGVSFYSKFTPSGTCGDGTLMIPYVALEGVNSNFLINPTPINYIAATYDFTGCVGVKNNTNASNVIGVFPNPTENNTTISYTLAANSTVSIELYNVVGERTVTLAANENQSAGNHIENLDMSKLSSGVYFLRTTINGEVKTTKITKN